MNREYAKEGRTGKGGRRAVRNTNRFRGGYGG